MTAPLTDADLARLVEMEKAATDAPWVDACNKIGADGAGIAEIDFDSDADRALVIQLRNAAPSLLAEVVRLRKLVATGVGPSSVYVMHGEVRVSCGELDVKFADALRAALSPSPEVQP
jgi:hypothetical protein